MSASLKLVAGLGNPGPQYLLTRHNIGFRFVDALAEKFSLCFSPDKKFHSNICRYQSDADDCLLCKPQTYVNESGTAIQALLHYYRIPTERILIVHDEIDLDTGVIRFKKDGGHGGHNGLRNIILKTGRSDFNRLRIGVGHPSNQHEVVSYVLNRPDKKDDEMITDAITRVIAESDMLFSGAMQKLMNSFNKKTA